MDFKCAVLSSRELVVARVVPVEEDPRSEGVVLHATGVHLSSHRKLTDLLCVSTFSVRGSIGKLTNGTTDGWKMNGFCGTQYYQEEEEKDLRDLTCS